MPVFTEAARWRPIAGVAVLGACDYVLKAPLHVDPRALRQRRCAAVAATEADGACELFGERVDLLFRAARARFVAERCRVRRVNIVRLCQKCHGDTYSGGPYPGAPASVLVPPNITPHATGLAEWTYEDFGRLLTTGIRKNGKMVDAVMPVDSLGKMDDVEKKAVWLALRALPPRPFGGR